MLPSGNNKKIKIKRTFEGHFPGLIWHIFSGSIEASFHEWKIRSNWFWEYLKKNITLERHVLESEIRIVILIFLNIIAFSWIVNQRFFVISLPYNYAFGEEVTDTKIPFIPNENPDLAGMTRLDSERKDNNDENKNEESQTIITELNKLISSQDERCQKDKENKECTELCVKNEEEIIAQMKAEERKGWAKYLSGKPRLLQPSAHISCAKDTKGARRSDTKGKHRDEDCCPDPDEWPKPGCRYSAAGLALMMKGPK